MMLIHKCRNCDHPETWHHDEGTMCSNGVCPCARADIDPNPRLVPTYHNNTPVMADGINRKIIAPGEAMNPHCPKFSHRATACNCDLCHDAYAAMTS